MDVNDALRVTVFFHALEGTGPLWRNGFWPLVNLVSEFGPMHLIEAPWQSTVAARTPVQRVRRRIDLRRHARALEADVPPETEPQDLFFAVALNEQMARLAAHTVSAMAGRVRHRVLSIFENVEAESVPVESWRCFDRITCFCPDLARQIEAWSGVRTLYWPPHLDTLRFQSLSAFRPVDLVTVGRGRTDVLFEMQRRSQGAERFCLDFVTRTQSNRAQSAEAEFRLLFDALAKSKTTLCFAPHDEPRFNGRSPLLARWVYAWAAGCVVFGTLPRGTGTAAEMDWEGAMVELPAEVGAAADLIEARLDDPDALRRQGRLNAEEAQRRHDTRYRFAALFDELGVAHPPALRDGLAALAARTGQAVSLHG
ncbi:MAG: hypothetical protein AAGA32_10150 [Pseudomonadota bacterium]